MALPLHGPVPAHESEVVVDVAGNEVKGNGKPYRQGMVFRCNLDGTEVETLGWNFATTTKSRSIRSARSGNPTTTMTAIAACGSIT
jgi:hypothetical protein